MTPIARDGSYIRPECIIVDMDGTLSDSTHRQHFMNQKPKDWKSFYGHMGMDPFNRWCKYLISKAPETIHVVVVSGRPEEHRQTTIDWLEMYSIDFQALFMRKNGDFRQDAVVKEEILHQEILPLWKPFFAIDDRQQVVNMWRRNGIVTLQCAEGDF